MKKAYSRRKIFGSYVLFIILQIYSDLQNSQSESASDPSENYEVCAEIEKMLQAEIGWTLKEQAPLGLEVLHITLRLPRNMLAQIFQNLQLNLGRLLDGILLTIEISADPTRPKEENFENQVLAFRKLEFLTKWVEIRPCDQTLVMPLTSPINLVHLLLKPLRCGDRITLAIADLIFYISISEREKWYLNSKQLQTISDAINEVMMTGDEKYRLEAGLLASKLVKEYSSKFDHSTNYPMDMFKHLREQVFDLTWNHGLRIKQSEEGLLLDDGNCKYQTDRLSKRDTYAVSMISATEAMQTLFQGFEDVQKKYIQQSPLTLYFIAHLKSQVYENYQMVHRLLQTLSAH